MENVVELIDKKSNIYLPTRLFDGSALFFKEIYFYELWKY